MAAKLRFHKNELKKWRARDHPREMDELMKLKRRLHELNTTVESNRLSDAEMLERILGMQRIRELEKLAILDLKQKARIKWTIDGDENTRFFEGYVNNKKSKNFIHRLIINGLLNTNVATIKSEEFPFYYKKFQERWSSRPKLISNSFNRLDSSIISRIEEPFTSEEIKNVV